VSPPSVDELRQRLIARGVAEGEELEERLEMARQEMIKAQVSPPKP
jgi:guanylate kinase